MIPSCNILWSPRSRGMVIQLPLYWQMANFARGTCAFRAMIHGKNTWVGDNQGLHEIVECDRIPIETAEHYGSNSTCTLLFTLTLQSIHACFFRYRMSATLLGSVSFSSTWQLYATSGLCCSSVALQEHSRLISLVIIITKATTLAKIGTMIIPPTSRVIANCL